MTDPVDSPLTLAILDEAIRHCGPDPKRCQWMLVTSSDSHQCMLAPGHGDEHISGAWPNGWRWTMRGDVTIEIVAPNGHRPNPTIDSYVSLQKMLAPPSWRPKP